MACARNVDIVITRQCLTLQKHCASIQALTRRAHAYVCVYIYMYVCAGARACVSYVCARVCTWMCMYARVWCPLSFDRYVMHKYFMTWATGARVPVPWTIAYFDSVTCRKKKKKFSGKKFSARNFHLGKNQRVYTRDHGEMDDKNLDDF